MRKLVILFDIDETLLHSPRPHELVLCHGQQQLTKSKGIDEKDTTYFIYEAKLKNIFECIISSKNIQIGFITAGDYPKEILDWIAAQYEIIFPENTLFVNRTTYGTQYTAKSLKIEELINAGHISKEDRIVLVDDNLEHLDSAVKAGFGCIRAWGHHYVWRKNSLKTMVVSDKSYIKHLNELIKMHNLELGERPRLRCNSI